MQLCFNNPLSNCTFDLLTNYQCDEQWFVRSPIFYLNSSASLKIHNIYIYSNNQYCAAYLRNSDFKIAFYWWWYNGDAAAYDSGHCLGWNIVRQNHLDDIGYNQTECDNSQDNNPYIDKPSNDRTIPVLTAVWDPGNPPKWECDPNDIDDSLCDDVSVLS